MKSSDSAHWQQAIDAELKSMEINDVWYSTVLPAGRKLVTTKWVFRPKHDIQGNITKYKARLVARGFEQIYGKDFDETYSPVTRLSSLRLLFALAMQFHLELQQMDVETAFLNATLNEEVYITIPEGIQVNPEHNCFRLKRALYGLKQSPRAWYEDIHKSLRSRDFKCMQNENCLFFKHTTHGLVIIALYVDDLIIAGSPSDVSDVKSFLNSRYIMKDLGRVNHILGCEVIIDTSSHTLFLTQRRYILSTVKKFLNATELHKTGLNASPMESSIPLTAEPSIDTPDGNNISNNIPYREAIGSLLWLVAGTRADIAFAVQTCAKFSNNPQVKHWKAILRIFRYLHRTINYGLAFRSTLHELSDSHIYKSCTNPNFTLDNFSHHTAHIEGFSDSDWGRDPDTRRSVSGYLMFLNAGLISWGSKRQQSVALSSMEAEYMALCLATQEAVWLIEIMKNFKFIQHNPIIIHEDNQACIEFANHNVHHAKSKHIQQRYHYTREVVKKGDIKLAYIPTSENPADIMTKPLTPQKHLPHFLRLMTFLSPSGDLEIDKVPRFNTI